MGLKKIGKSCLKWFIYNFYLYSGREEVYEDSGYSDLQESAQIVAKLWEGVPRAQGYMCYFDNWFSTVELFLHFGRKVVNAADPIRPSYFFPTQLYFAMPGR